jgi:TetR/AcrR family fatty acid metabolism transcriptional regulator
MSTEAGNPKKSRKAVRNPEKRLSIMKAAEKIFAKKGFHESTIADIARTANVSEATIYEYFNSKEELLFSIPSEGAVQHLRKNEEILQYVQGAANKIRVLIYRLLKVYDLNPDFAKVIMLLLKTNRNFLKTEAYRQVQLSARLTTQVVEEGVKSGEFRPDTKPLVVRAMIYGTIEHLVIRKSLLGKPVDLLSLADDVTKNILQGILPPRKEADFNIHVTVEPRDQARPHNEQEDTRLESSNKDIAHRA